MKSDLAEARMLAIIPGRLKNGSELQEENERKLKQKTTNVKYYENVFKTKMIYPEVLL